MIRTKDETQQVHEGRSHASHDAVRQEHDNFGSGGYEAFKPGMGIQFVDLTAGRLV